MQTETTKRQVGIFGGSFDPVHYGHLILAETCREALQLDEVLLIPAATSPLKPQGPVAAEAHRLRMLELAVGGTPQLRVDPLEIDRRGVSYTVDTLRAVGGREPRAELWLLVGADSVASMDRWHAPAEVLRLARLGVVGRAGHEPPDLGATAQLLAEVDRPRFAPRVVSMPAIEISSTELRCRVAAGRSIRFRTPRAVEAYIKAERLYQNAAG